MSINDNQVSAISGPMTLLSPRGLIYDEGVGGALTIIRNALKKENRQQFLHMFCHFRKNRHRLNYIAVVSVRLSVTILVILQAAYTLMTLSGFISQVRSVT